LRQAEAVLEQRPDCFWVVVWTYPTIHTSVSTLTFRIN